MNKRLTHGSLFSGAGGFDLAAQWAGFENVFHCEYEDYKREDLKLNFPNVISYEDITTTDFQQHRWQIDVLTGGFPCQNASIANTSGGRVGLDGSKTGLWRHMVRAIHECRPRFVVAENVANIIKINGGRDFGIILDSLASMGYNAEWKVLHASDIGAPHHRARLYLVAYSNSLRPKAGFSFFPNVGAKIKPKCWNFARATIQVRRGGFWESEPPVLCVDDGFPRKLARQAIHGYGNAIVPQLAFEIFENIKKMQE